MIGEDNDLKVKYGCNIYLKEELNLMENMLKWID